MRTEAEIQRARNLMLNVYDSEAVSPRKRSELNALLKSYLLALAWVLDEQLFEQGQPFDDILEKAEQLASLQRRLKGGAA